MRALRCRTRDRSSRRAPSVPSCLLLTCLRATRQALAEPELADLLDERCTRDAELACRTRTVGLVCAKRALDVAALHFLERLRHMWERRVVRDAAHFGGQVRDADLLRAACLDERAL